jgi:PhnB protein
MTGPEPYVLFPGTAREALTFYGDVFGCAVELHTFAEFHRADGPADAIAHGGITGDRSRCPAPTWPGTSGRSEPRA